LVVLVLSQIVANHEQKFVCGECSRADGERVFGPFQFGGSCASAEPDALRRAMSARLFQRRPDGSGRAYVAAGLPER
jgi:hypothetical protein